MNEKHCTPMTRGLRNNNPLNIRLSAENKWVGKVLPNTDGTFEQFRSLRYGIRAAALLLGKYYYHYRLNTINGIVARWAPMSENHTDRYARAVCCMTGIGGNEPLKPSQLTDVLYAMARVECGAEAIICREPMQDIVPRELQYAKETYLNNTTG